MKKIIITGGSGFLGTIITERLLQLGEYQVVVLDLVPPRISDERVSFYKANLLDAFDGNKEYELLKNPHAVIHLSGKNIFGRFTESHKNMLWDTRVLGTRHLVELFEREEYRPQFLVSASAVGYYGDQPTRELTESSDSRNGMFLAKLVEAWEQESLSATKFGVHVTCIRNAHILGKAGMLGEVEKQFKFGIGTVLGNGKQYMPWIHIKDLVELYLLGIEGKTPQIINGVSGSFDTARDFAHAIGRIRHTSLYLPIPRCVLRIPFGDFADEMLVDQKISSEHYSALDFAPKFSNINECIQDILSK